MQGSALGHRLETLHDGLTTFCDGEPAPVPLLATRIAVHVMPGMAVVRTVRNFRNAEETPIEAVMTFPVGFDAVVTGLAATIDGRRMVGVAKERAEARETYETALDEGKLSVLHEEALRGIHVLSIGALPPGAEVAVELEQAVPLSDAGGVPLLRLPMTAGQIYGTSPLLPSDDLVTADVRHEAELCVTLDQGRAVMDGRTLATDETVQILLDRAVELRIEGGTFGNLTGRSADGRAVGVVFEPTGAGQAELDLHVIVDRSGSTSSLVREWGVSVWEAMRDGLAAELAALRPADRITLWQFDDTSKRLGSASGSACGALVARLDGPGGGTELGGAIRAALGKGARDILVLTDGQTWAHLVDELKGEGPRISAILVGPASLDANIGHLCAMTGGQVLYAPGSDVASPLRTALAALRMPARAIDGQVGSVGPERLEVRRGGVAVRATWSASRETDHIADSDAVGRFAAALALPLLDAAAGEAWSRAHSLCTHSTSLVLVDEAGVATEGFSRMRKVPLMGAGAMFLRASVADAPLYREALENDALFVRRSETLARRSPALKQAINRSPRSWPAPSAASPRSSDAQSDVPPGRTGFLSRFLTREAKGADDPAVEVFRGFAWDVWGDALLRGDFSSLSVDQVTEMERLAGRIRLVRGPSIGLVTDPRILALGLIARRMGDRVAERFSRKALEGVPEWLLNLD